ncbi:MAG: Gfo/Idh/MocA family oxidoreductase [Pseudomonadota bacterium]
MTGNPLRIAVAGAGLVGRRHLEAIAGAGFSVGAVVDPDENAKALAERVKAPWFASLARMIDAGVADGVVIATPNQAHVPNGLACVAAHLPVLVEKPLATDGADGARLIEAAAAAGVPVLVGHHRRHNPLIQQAKAEIETGALGRLLAVHGMFWLVKPDDYFEAAWRRQDGAGPVFINLIHDVDLLRYLCGDIISVQAQEANAARGFAVEDTAAILLRFANGALGTFSVSDAIPAPWSWELTARENPAYPASGQSCYMIGGSEGAMEIPSLKVWSHTGAQSWWSPIASRTSPVGQGDPLIAQIRQFAAVIRGEEEPLVSGRDGLQALRIVEAVKHSARTGENVACAPHAA